MILETPFDPPLLVNQIRNPIVCYTYTNKNPCVVFYKATMAELPEIIDEMINNSWYR